MQVLLVRSLFIRDYTAKLNFCLLIGTPCLLIVGVIDIISPTRQWALIETICRLEHSSFPLECSRMVAGSLAKGSTLARAGTFGEAWEARSRAVYWLLEVCVVVGRLTLVFAAVARQHHSSDMALVGADGQAVDIEKAALNLMPSQGAAPEEGTKEHEAMGDLATLAGLPKGSNIPSGTLKALSNAWKRGNFVRSTTKRAEVMDGDQFYACTGNDYRGDFRAVDKVWLTDNGEGEMPTIITKLDYDETAPAPAVR